MTHIIRTATVQVGYVPPHSYTPHGIFDPEITKTSPVVYPENDFDSDEEPILYECRDCLAQLWEEELDDHDCEDYDLEGY